MTCNNLSTASQPVYRFDFLQPPTDLSGFVVDLTKPEQKTAGVEARLTAGSVGCAAGPPGGAASVLALPARVQAPHIREASRTRIISDNSNTGRCNLSIYLSWYFITYPFPVRPLGSRRLSWPMPGMCYLYLSIYWYIMYIYMVNI